MRSMEQNSTLPSAEKLEMEAAKWLANIDKLYDGYDFDLDEYAAQNAEFSKWVKTSVSNRVALLRLIAIWRRTSRMSALKSPNMGISRKRHEHKQFRYKLVGSALIAACLLVALMFGLQFTEKKYSEKTYQTAKGGHEVAPLVDGSTVELNSDTKFSVQMTDSGRLVLLEYGEAFFEVSHDESRPFKIMAGNHTVTVLGTKFAVHRSNGEIEVAVTEGRVEINEETSLNKTSPMIVTAGDIAKTEKGTVLVLNKSSDIVERELSWRHGFIVLDKKSLEEASREFSRYHDVEFVIEDQEVAEILVSGRFRLDNLDGFLRLLEEGFGFQVSLLNNIITISG